MGKTGVRLPKIALALFGFVFGFLTLFPISNTSAVEQSAETANTEETADSTEKTNPETNSEEPSLKESNSDTSSSSDKGCYKEAGAIGWFLCPVAKTASKAIDAIYGIIENFLVIKPISSDQDSAVYVVWEYMRNITNILFIIFILFIIYSQVTGIGINNYGIKKTLPRLVVAAILVNLSFLICSIAVDISNIIGNSLVGFFNNIVDSTLGQLDTTHHNNWGGVIATILAGGTTVGAVGVGSLLAGGIGALIFTIIPIIIGALISVIIGLIMISLRQALVIILIMISPLAFVAYMLPNTNQLFVKWKNLFTTMLVFYPTFSFLYGASSLAGWVIIASAENAFWLVIGMAVQVLPLIFSISLMKKSGTFLDRAGGWLDKVGGRVQKPISSLSAEKAAQSRAKHIANSKMPSARLQRYLDYRTALRNLNTKDNTETRANLATSRALTKRANYNGRDKNGHDTWNKKPNRYAHAAKKAAYTKTVADTAAKRAENTTSRYGSIFKDKKSQALAAEHGEAYKNLMSEQYLAANQAQADEDYLLGEFIDAANNRYTNPTKYNTLVKNAAGDLGLLGESSIMGQVIQSNAKTESRRRAEAGIMIAKFDYDRAAFHSAMTGQLRNMQGYAIDKEGNVIEDSMFNLLPGKEYVKWDKFEYDPVRKDKQGNALKVNYFDMHDDNGKFVQRVYMDDNGYMKELLANDIMIGDPVNRLYEMSVGLSDGNATIKNGPLRKYASTICGNITNWKDHSGGSTPMLMAMMRHGTLNTPGRFHIGYLQSLKAATKASAFLTNDKFIIQDLNKIFISTYPELFMDQSTGKFTEEAKKFAGISGDPDWIPFEKYISDSDIDGYKDVKFDHLDGLRIDADGTKHSIAYNDPSITLQDKKNLIQKDLIPSTMKKLFGLLNRNVSQNISDNQKPPTADALSDMLEVFSTIGQNDPSIFGTVDPNKIRRRAAEIKEAATKKHTTPSNNSNNSNSSRNNSAPISTYLERLVNSSESQSNPTNIINDINDILNISYNNSDELAAVLVDYFENNEELSKHTSQLSDIIFNNQFNNISSSTEEAIEKLTNTSNNQETIANIQNEIEDLILQVFHNI